MKLEDKVSNPEEEAHLHLPCYRTEGKWVYLRCSGCGKKVSTYLFPEGEFILRADITCPECLTKQPTYSDAIKACQSQVDEWEKEKQAKREDSKYKKQLRELSLACFTFLRSLDEVMKIPESSERGKLIAGIANKLELKNDSVRYSYLGVNYRTDNKEKIWQSLKERYEH